jgi:predicted phosphodiesterase
MNTREVCERIIKAPAALDWLGEEQIASVLKGISNMHMRLPNIVKLNGPTLFVGDIHADADSMLSAFKLAEQKDTGVVFLGDVVDRGSRELTCVNLVMAKCYLEPDRITYLRGNHEFAEINAKWGFADAVTERFGRSAYHRYNAWFSTLPLAALLNNRVLAIHGGVARNTPTLKSIETLDRTKLAAREETAAFLWNDPSEDIDGYDINTRRGIFYNFGRDVFEEFMDRNNLDLMIRGHEPWPDGFKYFFDKRLISVFSSDDYYKDVKPKAVLVENDGSHGVLAL